MDEKRELEDSFDCQREFDRKLGWNVYENLITEKDIVDYMQLTALEFWKRLGR